jgi:hypothetical protein
VVVVVVVVVVVAAAAETVPMDACRTIPVWLLGSSALVLCLSSLKSHLYFSRHVIYYSMYINTGSGMCST